MIYRKNFLKYFFILLLTGVPILFLAAPPSLAAYLVTPSAYWQLNDDPVAGAADDTGTINGTCTSCPVSTTGLIGNAFDFSSGDVDISFADNAVFDFPAPPVDPGDPEGFSIELWMKLDTPPLAGEADVLIGRYGGGGAAIWWIGVNPDGRAACLFKDTGSNGDPLTELNGLSNVVDGAWHHIAVVRNAVENTLSLYVDSVREAVLNTTGDDNFDGDFGSADAVTLGQLVSEYYYAGAMDNVAIYTNTVLSAAELSQNYLNGMCGHDLDDEFAPVFISDVTDTVILGFEATLEGSKAAGNPIPTYSSDNLPGGATIAPTGVITWLPNDQQLGDVTFSVAASNSQGNSSTNQNWTVTVNDLCTSDLDAYWKLDEADPSTDGATDSIGVVNGTCTTCPTSTAGQVGTAFDFSGADAFISFADDPIFDFAEAGDFTIELRTKLGVLPEAGNPDVLIGRDDTTTEWWVGVNPDGTLACYFNDSVGAREATQVNGTTNILDDAWHHIPVVRDGTADTLTLYVDGAVEVAVDQSGDTSSDNSFESTVDVTLGQFGSDYYYTGAIDDVAVYNTALSGTIVGQHANAASDQALCNSAPVIDESTAVTTATEGVAYSFTAAATDPEGHDITWSLTTNPSGMAIDAATGEVTWTPDSNATAMEDVEILATDTYGATDSYRFTIDVTFTGNNAPVIAPAPASATSATVGTAYSYDADATDADGDTLTWSLGAGAPAGMSVDPATGLVSWTPAEGSEGDVTYTLVANDGKGGTDSQPVTVTVSAAGTGTPAASDGGGGGGGCFITSLH